jgi:hypothetical protein
MSREINLDVFVGGEDWQSVVAALAQGGGGGSRAGGGGGWGWGNERRGREQGAPAAAAMPALHAARANSKSQLPQDHGERRQIVEEMAALGLEL